MDQDSGKNNPSCGCATALISLTEFRLQPFNKQATNLSRDFFMQNIMLGIVKIQDTPVACAPGRL